jgi:hypothetical protein
MLGTRQYTNVYFAGVGGFVTAGTTHLVYVKEWSLEASIELTEADTFYNVMDSFGRIWKNKTLLNLAEGKVELSGYSFALGEGVVFGGQYSLILGMSSNAVSRNFQIPSAICTSVSHSLAVDGVAEVKLSFEVNGAIIGL